MADRMIRIDNDGQRIAATNYWSTEHARRGLVYVSANAGAVRLLVPRGWPDLNDSRIALASLQIVGAQEAGVAHIVLEDGTATPAYLTIDARQCDRALPPSEVGRHVTLLVYGPDGTEGVRLLRELPGRIDLAHERPQ